MEKFAEFTEFMDAGLRFLADFRGFRRLKLITGVFALADLVDLAELKLSILKMLIGCNEILCALNTAW
jgi:hypothetical protein